MQICEMMTMIRWKAAGRRWSRLKFCIMLLLGHMFTGMHLSQRSTQLVPRLIVSCERMSGVICSCIMQTYL